MNYLKFGILFAVAVLFFGCIGGTPPTGGGASTGGSGSGGATGGSTAWCQAGGSWSYGGAEGSAQTVIKGMETYKGKQYCHVTTTSTTGSESYKVDYYFIEDANGEMTDMWMVMDYGNGQVYEQHMTQ